MTPLNNTALTDAELICEWMEPKPTVSIGYLDSQRMPIPQWWDPHEDIGGEWQPRALNLDDLWAVEERLIKAHKGRWIWLELEKALEEEAMKGGRSFWTWHADAPTRIKALAAVLRSPDAMRLPA